jgi:hypothetical protein
MSQAPRVGLNAAAADRPRETGAQSSPTLTLSRANDPYVGRQPRLKTCTLYTIKSGLTNSR